MRIKHIKIRRWRHFEELNIEPPDTSPVVCLVGGNGTGKSHILELLAACAEKIGLAAGFVNRRGDPFSEDAVFEISFLLTPGAITDLDRLENDPNDLIVSENIHRWDRTITIARVANESGSRITAGGIDNHLSTDFAARIVYAIKRSSDIHYLFLDADRSYSRNGISAHEVGDIISRDWNASNKQSSFKLTSNLYGEWFRYLIGRENQANNNFIRDVRKARDSGIPEPQFIDQFDNYKISLCSILPHLRFTGVDSERREVQFDSTGISLTFDQLSGGEREIAFLIGQIERFSLRHGLLLVDEPELHLNFDLLRSWIGFLKNSVENGQIWLATHSLEVVEVTGQDATFILERDDATRRVFGAKTLATQPVIASLSRAVGSPAFSISKLAFVMVEGEEEIGERERFRLLCGTPTHVRFLEAGSCSDVVRRIQTIKLLAAESENSIRIGGIVDGDWRSAHERSVLTGQGIHVLDVHEIENFFLHPPTLQNFLETNGAASKMAIDLVNRKADLRAGSWIFNAARTDRTFQHYPPSSTKLRNFIHGLSWEKFADLEGTCLSIAELHGDLNEAQTKLLSKHLVTHARIYARKRDQGDLWRVCEGKEVFRSILGDLGLRDEDAGERSINAVWVRRPDLLPPELSKVRSYVGSL